VRREVPSVRVTVVSTEQLFVPRIDLRVRVNGRALGDVVARGDGMGGDFCFSQIVRRAVFLFTIVAVTTVVCNYEITFETEGHGRNVKLIEILDTPGIIVFYYFDGVGSF